MYYLNDKENRPVPSHGMQLSNALQSFANCQPRGRVYLPADNDNYASGNQIGHVTWIYMRVVLKLVLILLNFTLKNADLSDKLY